MLPGFVVFLLQTSDVPERDAADASKLQFSFQHLLYLSFLGSFLHLLSTNQIDSLGGQDQISLDRLCCDGKKEEVRTVSNARKEKNSGCIWRRGMA